MKNNNRPPIRAMQAVALAAARAFGPDPRRLRVLLQNLNSSAGGPLAAAEVARLADDAAAMIRSKMTAWPRVTT
jgi:hypothetical protein